MIWRCPKCGYGGELGICEYTTERGPCPECGSTILEFIHFGFPVQIPGSVTRWVLIDTIKKEILSERPFHSELMQC